MNLFTLAAKNLKRHKMRAFITLTAVVFGVVAYILVDSLVMGGLKQSLTNLIKYETGQTQLLTQDSFDNYSRPLLQDSFDAGDAIEVLKKAGIKSYPRMKGMGELTFYENDGFELDGSITRTMVGLNPDFEEIPDLKEGQNFKDFQNPNALGIWLGTYYKDLIGAEVGNMLTVKISTAYGSEELLDVQIAGLYETDNGLVNTAYIYFDTKDALALLEIDSPTSATNLLIDSPTLPPSVSQIGLVFKDYNALAPEVIASSKSRQGPTRGLIGLIFIIVVIGISNTMMMAIYERFNEIGTLRAFGMSRLEIRKLFMYEGLIIGVIGSIIGAAIALTVNSYLVNHGLDSSSAIDQSQNLGVRVNTVQKGYWNAFSFIFIMLSNSFLASFFAFTTASNAFKKSIIECLRND